MGNKIRTIEAADARAVSEIYAPYVINSATSFELVAPDEPECRKRIDAVPETHPWLVFEADQQVVGFAYASKHASRHAYQWSADVSVYVHQRAHRCGVGRALYTSLFYVLRRQGFYNAYAGITLPNANSVGLHESLGFIPIGVYSRIGYKFGRWHDVLWLQLRLTESVEPVASPRGIAEVLGDGSVRATLETSAQDVHVSGRE